MINSDTHPDETYIIVIADFDILIMYISLSIN